ncbi:ATP-binding cassette domain-containing protein, partial [bacterium]|nr:ATP-binding cassette domain-containing protein [bacterium]
MSVAKRQLVEIARAFHHQSKLLILDEPTSALSSTEVRHLFQVIQRMRGQMTFIYISHKLDEVFELADRIIVLRDG